MALSSSGQQQCLYLDRNCRKFVGVVRAGLHGFWKAFLQEPRCPVYWHKESQIYRIYAMQVLLT